MCVYEKRKKKTVRTEEGEYGIIIDPRLKTVEVWINYWLITRALSTSLNRLHKLLRSCFILVHVITYLPCSADRVDLIIRMWLKKFSEI